MPEKVSSYKVPVVKREAYGEVVKRKDDAHVGSVFQELHCVLERMKWLGL